MTRVIDLLTFYEQQVLIYTPIQIDFERGKKIQNHKNEKRTRLSFRACKVTKFLYKKLTKTEDQSYSNIYD